MGWCVKSMEAKQNLPTLMRILSIMKRVRSAKVKVIRSWRLTPSLIISESVIWTKSSDHSSEREFIPTNMCRSSKRTASPQLRHSTVNSTCPELVSTTMAMLSEFAEILG